MAQYNMKFSSEEVKAAVSRNGKQPLLDDSDGWTSSAAPNHSPSSNNIAYHSLRQKSRKIIRGKALLLFTAEQDLREVLLVFCGQLLGR